MVAIDAISDDIGLTGGLSITSPRPNSVTKCNKLSYKQFAFPTALSANDAFSAMVHHRQLACTSTRTTIAGIASAPMSVVVSALYDIDQFNSHGRSVHAQQPSLRSTPARITPPLNGDGQLGRPNARCAGVAVR